MGFVTSQQDLQGHWLLSHERSVWQLSTSSNLQTASLLFFSALGLFITSSYALSFVRMLLSVFVLPGKPLHSLARRGSYAVITGASDGIGAQYAYGLAAQGYNLLLISRTASKLSKISETIRTSNPKVNVETLPFDFSKALVLSDYAPIASFLSGKEVTVLINNVGLSHAIPVPFSETPDSEIRDIIAINCLATLHITQLVLRGMLSRKDGGLILTMGSFGGLLPTPYLATYSASKAFLQQWSNALAAELAPHNIAVHFVHSYLVTSAMSKIRRTSLLIPSEKAFVKATLAKIGRRGGAVGYAWSGTPYWSHAVMEWAILTFLGAYGKLVARINLKMHQGIRKRALRKAERQRIKSK